MSFEPNRGCLHYQPRVYYTIRTSRSRGKVVVEEILEGDGAFKMYLIFWLVLNNKVLT